MGLLFDLPISKIGRDKDKTITKKSKQRSQSVVSVKGGSGVMQKISSIKSMVDRTLGHLKDEYIIIQDYDELNSYIDRCIENNVISIDTETDGLDPMINHIAGLCIYTPDMKAAYVPINHISYIDNHRVSNQLTEQQVADVLNRCIDANINIVMFNAKFDIRVLRNQCGLANIYCTWDGYLAARLLNENEGAGNNGLKKLHQKYVLNGEGDAFKFDDLFNGIEFTKIPINVGYIYAAHDAIITYELYKYQEQYLDGPLQEQYNLKDVSWVFHNIEMPMVLVCADMEDSGIDIDLGIAQNLSEKYHTQLDEKLDVYYKILDDNKDKIDYYVSTHKDCKLENPINIRSSSQLAVLLYDILELPPPVDKKTKKVERKTGEDILSAIDHPICKAILEYRTVDKLINTYIDKLPNCVSVKDSRIHCNFNQYGADTGRMSSSDPNLQNIPSHNKDIRQMFKATDGYVLMSSDFSQQENCDYFIIDRWCEVETLNGWQYADKVVAGDVLKTQDDYGKDTTITVNKIVVDKNHIIYYY